MVATADDETDQALRARAQAVAKERLRPYHELSADLADRPLQLPLRLLHAGNGHEVPAARRDADRRGADRVVGAFARLGFTKFRLTGGEPTIRPHLVDIVRAIKQFPGVEEVTMTTNALLLGRMADGLADAGTRPDQCQPRHARP